ncbi:MAG: rRNA maturation RNase YbeY [Ginsengibacter sp.]
MPSITFKNSGVQACLKNKQEVKRLISFIFKNEGFDLDKVSFIFSSDDAILRLNKEFLNHDTLTDILTFTLSDPSEPVFSEIYISVERVKENSKKFGVSYLEELYRVMVHGILHLCGFSDHSSRLKSEMREKENFYLKMIRFT